MDTPVLDIYLIYIALAIVLTYSLIPKFKDDYRLDTIKSYKQWLTLQGELPGITHVNFSTQKSYIQSILQNQ
jgi:hypothetical protein